MHDLQKLVAPIGKRAAIAVAGPRIAMAHQEAAQAVVDIGFLHALLEGVPEGIDDMSLCRKEAVRPESLHHVGREKLSPIMIVGKSPGRSPGRLKRLADQRNVPDGRLCLDFSFLAGADRDEGNFAIKVNVARRKIDDLARTAAGLDQHVGDELQFGPKT
jgi:hypothetical protein